MNDPLRPLWERPEWMRVSDMHCDWDGNPINLLQMTMLLEDPSYRYIAQTHLMRWGLTISTVWLGANHQFMPGGRPIVFETMVFRDWGIDMKNYDDLMWRHYTREDALIEHGLIVEGVMKGQTYDEISDVLAASDLTGSR